ncbi:hypothetical protein GMMP15_1300024 [Candidatus Magnetomoraceae bacterium gMMP-15]
MYKAKENEIVLNIRIYTHYSVYVHILWLVYKSTTIYRII